MTSVFSTHSHASCCHGYLLQEGPVARRRLPPSPPPSSRLSGISLWAAASSVLAGCCGTWTPGGVTPPRSAPSRARSESRCSSRPPPKKKEEPPAPPRFSLPALCPPLRRHHVRFSLLLFAVFRYVSRTGTWSPAAPGTSGTPPPSVPASSSSEGADGGGGGSAAGQRAETSIRPWRLFTA